MVRPLLVAFVGGAISFVLVRIWFSTEESTFAASFAAIIALLIIALLGMHYHSRPATDLRLAGDNLYYLGLLFTLWSLIIALVQLFVFQPEDDDLRQRTHDLIGNFGIALISTIAGILGRILLQSLSDEKAPDRREKAPDRQEDDVQVENLPPSVSDSLMALRSTLREATNAFSHFTRVTQNQAEQAKAHSEILIRQFNDRMSDESKRGLSEVMATWRKSTEAIAAANNDLMKHFDQEVATATKRTETAWRGLAEEMTTVSESARLQLASCDTEMSTTLNRVAAASEALNSFATGLAAVESGTRSLGASASRAATSLDDRAVEITDAYKALAEGARHVQQIGLAEYREAIESFMKAARDQLEQEGAKWLISVTAITESAEARLKKATNDAETARLAGERILEEADRSLAVVERISDSLEKAVHALDALRRPGAPGRGRSRWMETTWKRVKRLLQKD